MQARPFFSTRTQKPSAGRLTLTTRAAATYICVDCGCELTLQSHVGCLCQCLPEQPHRPPNPLSPSPYLHMRLADIYDDPTPFAKQPNSYKCPTCNAPKRRFQPYSGSGKNDAKSMSTRMKSLKAAGTASKASSGSSEGGDNTALLAAVGGAVLLAALYFGASSVYN